MRINHKNQIYQQFAILIFRTPKLLRLSMGSEGFEASYN